MAAIFLDLDGTLTDPKPGITGAVRYALTQVGLVAPSADQLEWVIGPSLLDSFRKLGTPDPAHALAIYRARYSDSGLYDCTVFDGIPQALSALRAAGHRLFLATAKPHVYATRITAYFGLADELDRQFGPELDGTRQDKADLLRYTLDVTGLDAADCIMVGDRHHDLDAARANDLRFVGVNWGYGSDQELAMADHRCSHPSELLGVIASLSG